MERTYLVTGATGSLGSAVLRVLRGPGVRVMVRDAEAFEAAHGAGRHAVVEGDLANQEDVDRAIDGVDTVLHCAGAPYFHWGDMIGHTIRLIRAAEEEEKVVDIVFPGNVHVYGDVGGGTITEAQDHMGGTRKGDIRLNIERRLREANARGECRTTVARFPDLYGPGVRCRAAERIFPAAVEGRAVTWPGDLDAEREFLYVDDAVRAMLHLSESDVSWGRAWHVPGPAVTTAREFITMAFEAAGMEPDMKAAGRTALKLKGATSRECMEEVEIFYLFERPPILDGSRWRRTYGEPPSTPYAEGIRRTVEWWRAELAR